MFSPPMQGDYDGYHRRRYQQQQVPAFGSWDCFQDVDDLSRCFEAARQAGYIRYATDRDLYVAGDLYEDHVVTPTMIVVPRPMAKVVVDDPTKDEKEKGWIHDDDVAGDGDLYEDDYLGRRTRRNPKPVDEDLYKISPQLLRSIKSKHRKKRGVLRFLTSCLVPCTAS